MSKTRYLLTILTAVVAFIGLAEALRRYLMYLEFTVTNSIYASLLVASANIVFVFLVLYQIQTSIESLRKQEKSLEKQEKSIRAERRSIDIQEDNIEAQKASFQPLIKTDFRFNPDTCLKASIANIGNGPAKNIKVNILLESKELRAFKISNLGALRPKEKFVRSTEDDPDSYLDLGNKYHYYTDFDEDEGELVKDFYDFEWYADGPIRILAIITYENILGEKLDKKVAYDKVWGISKDGGSFKRLYPTDYEDQGFLVAEDAFATASNLRTNAIESSLSLYSVSFDDDTEIFRERLDIEHNSEIESSGGGKDSEG